MLDLQKQRFKHLLANAILELWKKETGSLSSVLIEGTICISSGTGRTTVIQVADHFMGVLHDSALNASATAEQPLPLYTESSEKKHDSGAFSDVESDLNVTDDPDDEHKDVNGNDYDTVDKNCRQERETPPATPAEKDMLPLHASTPVLDLRKDEDLSISSPANYTTQVRDVIKQKYLSQRPVSTPPTGPVAPWFLPPSSHHHLANVHMLAAAAAAASLQPPAIKKRALSSPFMPYSPHPVSEPTHQPKEKRSDSSTDEKRSYRCEYCDKKFMFKSKYNEHLPVHTNERPFQCHLCSRTYKYKYDLQVHLRTHMGIPTKSTICPFCQVKFESNKLLRQHIQAEHRDVGLPNEDSEEK